MRCLPFINRSYSGGLVFCPICNKQLLLKNINIHIDSGCAKDSISSAKPKSKKQDRGDTKQQQQENTKAAWSLLMSGKGKEKERCDMFH